MKPQNGGNETVRAEHAKQSCQTASHGRWPRTVILAAALLGMMAACKSDIDEPADMKEYHGGPSGVVCGQRWSYDVTGFYCDGGRMRLDQLRPFWSLKTVRFADSRIESGAAVKLERVFDVGLNNAQVDGAALAAAFPNLRGLLLDRTTLEPRNLHAMTKLEDLLLFKVSPLEASDLAAITRLKQLSLTFLQCPVVGCAQDLANRLHELRPDVEIWIDGHVVRW